MRRKKLKMFDVLLKYWTGGLSWKLAIKFIFHSSSKTGILYFHNILQFAIKFCVALAGNAKTRKLCIIMQGPVKMVGVLGSNIKRWGPILIKHKDDITQNMGFAR